tara:strand:+ start:20 stop:346 length:327 start_codon:yes stop_codon:yes gene_type:complete
MATNNIEKQSFGQAGATLLSGTEGVAKEICAITIIEDTIFDGHDDDTDGFADADHSKWPEFTDSSVAAKQLFRTTAADGVTVPAGITIYGQFSSVKLRSGTVLCYHAA